MIHTQFGTPPTTARTQDRAGDVDGPDPLFINIDGNPLPKARPRIALRRGRTRAYTPPQTKAWELTVATQARIALGARDPLEGPLAVELRFYRCNRTRVDLDNLAKAILDALNGIAYHDDDQVVEAHLYRAVDPDNPRVEITVWSVPS